ncbi:unnamed protein product [Symbiodinium sp. CCMP2592]|nr:unnamed protein product [Symbiodinium sp. CCMP2592]
MRRGRGWRMKADSNTPSNEDSPATPTTNSCGEQFPSRNEQAAKGNEAEVLPRTPTSGTRRRRRNRKAANAPKSTGAPPPDPATGKLPPAAMWRGRGRRMKATSDELSNEGLPAKPLSGPGRRHRNAEKRNENLLTTPRGKQHLVWRPKIGTCGEQFPLLQRVQQLESKCQEMELRLAELSRTEGPRHDRADAACQTDGEGCSVAWSLPKTSTASSTTSTTSCQSPIVGDGDSAHEVFMMPNLLPYLSVEDLLHWRRLSQRTRSPQVASTLFSRGRQSAKCSAKHCSAPSEGVSSSSCRGGDGLEVGGVGGAGGAGRWICSDRCYWTCRHAATSASIDGRANASKCRRFGRFVGARRTQKEIQLVRGCKACA